MNKDVYTVGKKFVDELLSIKHSSGPWKEHKYVSKDADGNYIYPDDYKTGLNFKTPKNDMKEGINNAATSYSKVGGMSEEVSKIVVSKFNNLNKLLKKDDLTDEEKDLMNRDFSDLKFLADNLDKVGISGEEVEILRNQLEALANKIEAPPAENRSIKKTKKLRKSRVNSDSIPDSSINNRDILKEKLDRKRDR